jgi:hypothetical protein
MQVKLSWAERFLNYMHETKLYIRGSSKCKDHMETMKLEQEVADSLKPLFEQFRNEVYEEAYLEGYTNSVKGDKSGINKVLAPLFKQFREEVYKEAYLKGYGDGMKGYNPEFKLPY